MPNKGKQEEKNKLIGENALLKARISYSIGSIETINYLLKNTNPEMLQKNLDHLRGMIERVLSDLKKEI
jgi:hypothetical protein